jgi:hypothetical protein
MKLLAQTRINPGFAFLLSELRLPVRRFSAGRGMPPASSVIVAGRRVEMTRPSQVVVSRTVLRVSSR